MNPYLDFTAIEQAKPQPVPEVVLEPRRPDCANCHKPYDAHWQEGGGRLRCQPNLHANTYYPER